MEQQARAGRVALGHELRGRAAKGERDRLALIGEHAKSPLTLIELADHGLDGRPEERDRDALTDMR